MEKNNLIINVLVRNINKGIKYLINYKLSYSFLFLLVISCTYEKDDVVNDLVDNYAIQTELTKRSYSEALNAAYNVINYIDDKGVMRSNGENKKLDLENGVKYIVSPSSSITKTSTNQLDTLMYVFNYENDEGFVIISASKMTPPILAFTDKGYYDPSEIQDNIGFEFVMYNTRKYVSDSFRTPVRSHGPFTPIEFEPIYTILSSVGNFINVQWGQTGVEGKFCPNGISGCANTASAMLMSYYEYPQAIKLQHDSYVNPNYSLNWTKMKYHKRDHQYGNIFEPYISSEDSLQSHDMISHLCRQLGVLAGSTYYNTSTGTNTNGILSSLSSMGYNTSGSTINYTQNGLVAILNTQHPVYMTGYFYDTDGYPQGHAWLVDGYRYYSIYDPAIMVIGDDGSITYGDTYYRYYNHINWGWDGRNNGFFIANSFSTSGGWYDTGYSISGNYNFNINLCMHNIYPNQ